MPPKGTCHEEAGVLCYEGAYGHTFNLHVQSIYKDKTGKDVHHILRDGNEHGIAGVLHPDEPTRKAIQSQYGRRSPNADAEVKGSKTFYFGCGVDEGKSHSFNWVLKQNEGTGDEQSYASGASEQAHGFGIVLPSVGL